MFAGYLNRDDATRAVLDADGWFYTGDLATRAADGQLKIVGRRSTDIIKCGGFKVGAGEVEEALLEHPAVAEAAVIGAPDRISASGSSRSSSCGRRSSPRRSRTTSRACCLRTSGRARCGSSRHCLATRWARYKRRRCADGSRGELTERAEIAASRQQKFRWNRVRPGGDAHLWWA